MNRFTVTFVLLLITSLIFCQSPAIKVVRSGKGSPVLFLPGFTTPGSVWNETIKNLKTENESHVVSYAGFNKIEPIDTPWYAVIKQELLAYINKEKLSELTIIGHSMGGNLAIDLAAALPQKVNKLILVDAIPCMRELMMPGIPAVQLQYNSPYNKQMLRMKDDAFHQVAAMMAANMTMNEMKRDTLTKWIMEADRNTYVYGYTDLLKLDLRDMLKGVKTETLILGASFPSAEVTKRTFEQQYVNLVNKTIAIAEKSKHFIMFDQPDWLSDRINDFLQK